MSRTLMTQTAPTSGRNRTTASDHSYQLTWRQIARESHDRFKVVRILLRPHYGTDETNGAHGADKALGEVVAGLFG
jgi:hypothetical protein